MFYSKIVLKFGVLCANAYSTTESEVNAHI